MKVANWGRALARRAHVAAVVAILGVIVVAPGAQAVVEPVWPAQCPLSVGLLLDRSSSMSSSFSDVQDASKDLVDALRGQHTKVMIIGFGSTASVIRPLTDVAEKSGRDQVKSAIDALGTFSGNQGGTNWDDALQLAGRSSIGVAVVLSDGDPTAWVQSVPESDRAQAALRAAQASADELKKNGTRVVPVGIGLTPGAQVRLAAISGPVAGDDYYVTDLGQLRRQLYDIASKSCGVPISALPTPEPPGFPLKLALLGVLAVLAVILVTGVVLHRVRNGSATDMPAPALRSARVRPIAPIMLEQPQVENSAPRLPSVDRDSSDPSPPARSRGRSMSLDFLKQYPPGIPDRSDGDV